MVNHTQKKGGTDNKVTLSTLIIHFTPSVESSLYTVNLCQLCPPPYFSFFALSLILCPFLEKVYTTKAGRGFFFPIHFFQSLSGHPRQKIKRVKNVVLL